MRAEMWSGQQEANARGLGVLAHSQNHLLATQVPPTAFYFNSGLFLIFFRSENYSPAPLERPGCSQ